MGSRARRWVIGSRRAAGLTCGLWMTSSGARGELLSVHGSSRAELAPWSTNQFGEEGKINTVSPTWSQGGNIFLLVLIICCLCEIDADIKSRPFVSEFLVVIAVWYMRYEVFFWIWGENLNQIPGIDIYLFLRLMITVPGLCDQVRKIFEHHPWAA